VHYTTKCTTVTLIVHLNIYFYKQKVCQFSPKQYYCKKKNTYKFTTSLVHIYISIIYEEFRCKIL